MVIHKRVRSWLRMNAGGVPNTCKSSEVKFSDLTERRMGEEHVDNLPSTGG